jgi:hypothetical protein
MRNASSPISPKLPARYVIPGSTWCLSTGRMAYCYFKLSGMRALWRWKAYRWVLVGSVSIGPVARWSIRPRKL